jgi:short-subunit dehydrogenase
VGNQFREKTVIVTGGSSGIGAATAKLFLDAGARVVLAARSADVLQRTAESLGAPETVLPVPTDVSDGEAAAALLDLALQRFGAIHVLVNNAGYNARGPVESLSVDELLRIVDVNLRAPIALTRLALPHIRRAGGGAIINVASLAGKIPLADEAVYSATKFALRVFSFALSEELRGSGITVSVVSPGPVDTGFIQAGLEEIPDIVFSQPMSSPGEIARVIVRCAQHGHRECSIPRYSGYLTTLGYLMPRMARALKPLFVRMGQRRKQRYRAQLRAERHL